MIDDILALQTIRCQYEHGRKKLLVRVNLKYCNVNLRKPGKTSQNDLAWMEQTDYFTKV